MANQRALNVVNILSIICGVWFIALGWMWTWLINVIFAFPVALIGFILWLFGRKAQNKKLNKIAGWLLVIGAVTSIATLLVWTISANF